MTQATIILERKGEQSPPAQFSTQEKLWGVLKRFEGIWNTNLTSLQGVPDVEVNKYFDVHINVPGYLQPVLKFQQRTIDTQASLQALSLLDIGVTGNSDEAVVLQLSHKYIAPPISPDKAAETIERFRHLLMEHNTAHAPDPLPPRNLKIWRSSAEQRELVPDEESSEFFEVSEADSRLYAQRILTEAKGSSAPTRQDRSSKTKKDFKRARLRIRVANLIFIEATFAATETIGDVVQYLRSNVLREPPDTPPSLPSFFLFLSPPRQVLSTLKRSVASYGLCPASLVNLGWQSPPSSPSIEDILLPSALELLEPTTSPKRVCLECGRVLGSVSLLGEHQARLKHTQTITAKPL